MEKLLFRSSVGLQHETIDDCIRQSIIDLEIDTPSTDEMLEVLSEALSLASQDLPQTTYQGLICLIHSLQYECRECNAKLLQYVNETRRLDLISLDISAKVRERKIDLVTQCCKTVQSMVFMILTNENDENDYRMTDTHLLQLYAKSAMIVCPTDESMENILSYYRDHLDECKEAERVLVDMLLKRNMLHILPPHTVIPADKTGMISNARFKAMLENMSDDAFKASERALRVILSQQPTRDKALAYITRCCAVGHNIVDSEMLLEYLEPTDIPSEAWKYMSFSPKSKVAKKFLSMKNKVSDIPPCLVCYVDWKKLMRVASVENLVQHAIDYPKTVSDYECLFARHPHQSLLENETFWLTMIERVMEEQEGRRLIRNLPRGKISDAVFVRLLQKNNFSESVCNFVANVTRGATLIRLIAKSNPLPMNCLNIHEIIDRLNLKELLDQYPNRKYELLCWILMSGCGIRSSRLPSVADCLKIDDFTILPQTEESMIDISRFVETHKLERNLEIKDHMSEEAWSFIFGAIIYMVECNRTISLHVDIDLVKPHVLEFFVVVVIISSIADRLRSILTQEIWNTQTFFEESMLESSRVCLFLCTLFERAGMDTSLVEMPIVRRILHIIYKSDKVLDDKLIVSTKKLLVKMAEDSRNQVLAILKEDTLDILNFLLRNASTYEMNLDGSKLGHDECDIFFADNAAKPLTMNFIILTTVMMCHVPKFSVDDVSPIIEMVATAGEIELRAIVMFLKYLGRDDIIYDMHKLDMTENMKYVIIPEFSRFPELSEMVTFELFMEHMKKPRGHLALCSLIRNYICDFDNAVNMCRSRIESVLSHSMVWSIASIYDQFKYLYSMFPKEFCTALNELYEVQDGAEFIIKKAIPVPPRNYNPLRLDIITKLIEEEKRKHDTDVFRAISVITDYIAGAMAQLPIPVRDVLEIALTQAENVVDLLCQFDLEPMPELIDTAEVSSYAFQLLQNLLSVPSIVAEFLNYLSSDVTEMTDSRFTCCILVLHHLLTMRATQLYTTVMLIKMNWAARLSSFLSKLTSIEKTKRTEAMIFLSLKHECEYLEILNHIDAKSAPIYDELMQADDPYTLAFGDIVTIGVQNPFGYYVYQFLPRKLRNFFLVASHNLVLSQKLWVTLTVDAMRIALVETRVESETHLPLPPYIPEESYNQLSLHAKCNVLHCTMSNFPAQITPAMERRLLYHPSWVSDIVNDKLSLMLMPDHYCVLHQALTDLNEYKDHVESIVPEDLTLMELCQPELVTFVLKTIMSKSFMNDDMENTVKSLFITLSNNVIGFAAILDNIAEILEHPDRINWDNMISMLTLLMKSRNASSLMEPAFLETVVASVYLSPSNIRVIYNLVKIYKSAVKGEMSMRVMQSVIFILLRKKDKSEILDLFNDLPESSYEYAAPYIQLAFNLMLEDLGDLQNGLDTLVPWINKFSFLVLDKSKELADLLDRMLTRIHRGENTSCVGSLLRALCPKRNVTRNSGSLFDSHSASVAEVAVTNALHLPQAIYDKAPFFWDVIAKHKQTIEECMQSRRLRRQFGVLLSYPEIVSFPIRKQIFQARISELINDRRYEFRVNRSDIVNDSFRKVKISNLKHSLRVQFEGEAGIDAGGVRRDWFTSVVKELFNPNYALFIPSANKSSYQPNPSAHVNSMYRSYFSFAGAVLARSIIEGVCVEAHLTRSLMKNLLGLKMSLRDLEEVDSALHSSLVWILENDPADIGLTFVADVDTFGFHTTVDLIENGSEVEVTEENKAEYVRLMVQHRLLSQIEESIKYFREGFNALIPLEEIQGFTPEELDLIICGIPEVDIDDFQANCEIEGFRGDSPVVQMFFNVLRGFTPDELGKLLLFMTGASKVPVGGFRTFAEGGESIKIVRDRHGPGRLPSAHTCMNQIDLPEYRSEEELKAKLLLAINESGSFGMA